MKKIIAYFLLLTLMLSSCSVKKEQKAGESSQAVPYEQSISDSLDNSSNSYEASETSDISNTSSTSDDPIITYPIEQTENIVVTIDGMDTSELAYYSHFGNNIYIVAKDENGNFGTKRITDGVETAFYPNAYNVYEQDGVLYGMIAHSGCSCDVERSYGRLFEDGTHEVLVDCWNVYYIGDKIYYYGINEGKRYIISADINGTNSKIVSDELPQIVNEPQIYKYDDYSIYAAGSGGIYARNSNGATVELYNDNTINTIHYVKNGFVYYSVCRIINSYTFEHSLWRVDVNGNNCECIIEASNHGAFVFEAMCLNDKNILFLWNEFRVYDSDYSQYVTYSYLDTFGFEYVEQICKLGDEIAVFGTKEEGNYFPYNVKVIIFDINGNKLFDNID